MADQPESGDSDAPADTSVPTAVDSAGSKSGSADEASDATTTDGGTTQTGLPADETEQPSPSTVDDEIVTVLVYPFAGETINFLWSSHIPEAAANRPRLYGPLEFILTKLKVAGLAGLLLGLPVFVYQTYRFMRPGLYPTERRYYLASGPTSLVLGIAGVLFAHFLILPFVFAYFTTYTAEAAAVAF